MRKKFYYSSLTLKMKPAPNVFKVGKYNKNVITCYRNCIYQFIYKGNELAERPKVASGIPEFRGTQFDDYCSRWVTGWCMEIGYGRVFPIAARSKNVMILQYQWILNERRY
jgi:hypothetical protein